MSQFSSHESVSLEKQVNLTSETTKTASNDIINVYEIHRCAEWIKSNNFQKVCLQFPDYLLPDSRNVAEALQDILSQTVYILGDTAYESCCIDYVAAAHINADAIIHFGAICFSKTSANISYLNIYEKHTINVDSLRNSFCRTFNDVTDKIVVVVDSPYIYQIDNIKKTFESFTNVNVERIDAENLNIKGLTSVVVGQNVRKLLNMELVFEPKALFYYISEKECIDKCEPDSKVLKRRYFLIEKIRDSKTIGIVIGTLAVQNYLKVIERVKKLIELTGKKYYMISVGKPTVAKLANFPELEVYVMITCAMNEIYDSRDFWQPIATPYDIEIALNSEANDLKFSYDYNTILSNSSNDLTDLKPSNCETDVSLLSGKIRTNVPEDDVLPSETTSGNELMARGDGVLAVNSNFGAGFLNERSWKGLEQNLGQTEVKVAEEGRSGIAGGYKSENC